VPTPYGLYNAIRTVAACLLTLTALVIVCAGLSMDCNLAR
jgi:hypothetical protein